MLLLTENVIKTLKRPVCSNRFFGGFRNQNSLSPSLSFCLSESTLSLSVLALSVLPFSLSFFPSSFPLSLSRNREKSCLRELFGSLMNSSPPPKILGKREKSEKTRHLKRTHTHTHLRAPPTLRRRRERTFIQTELHLNDG